MQSSRSHTMAIHGAQPLRRLTLSLSLLAPMPAWSANWLLIQGTEPAQSTKPFRPWGFAQLEYQTTAGSRIDAGPWSGQDLFANLIGPDKTDSSQLQLKRARLGARGRVPGLSQLNYALAVDAGNNGATKYATTVQLIDASLTYSVAPTVRLRVGQFKTPGSEEGMQPAFKSNYINPSRVADQLVNETFFNGDGSIPNDPNRPNGARSAYHDIGAQLFGVLPFSTPRWEHSYAVMVGNGNGIARPDNDHDKDLYLYWSSEMIFGGKGAKRDGLKLYAWWQEGKRRLTKPDVASYRRERAGTGAVYRDGAYRLSGEYIRAEGMIPNGTDGGAVPGSWSNQGTALSSFNLLPKGEASGWYLEGGYAVTSKLELDLRYDRLDRGTDSATTERRFTTWTLGVQYRIDRHWRVMANYQWRDASAPRLAASATPNRVLAGMDDLFGVQLQAEF